MKHWKLENKQKLQARKETHMESVEKRETWRHRVSVSQTSTGKNSFDCSVESTGATMEEVLVESDKLVAALRYKYPIG